MKKEILTQMFFSGFCENLKNVYYRAHSDDSASCVPKKISNIYLKKDILRLYTFLGTNCFSRPENFSDFIFSMQVFKTFSECSPNLLFALHFPWKSLGFK